MVSFSEGQSGDLIATDLFLLMKNYCHIVSIDSPSLHRVIYNSSDEPESRIEEK